MLMDSPSTVPGFEARAWRARLTLEQKVGQLLMIGFDGTALTPELRAMVEQYHVGGVVFLARNVETPQQVARLTAELQEAAHSSGHPRLLLAIDQEGGRVARLTEDKGFTQFPSAMALGATGSANNARLAAQALAAEMAAVGLNVNFAPVLDVNNNPANPVIGTRSFGSDPQRVAEYGVAFLHGLEAAGVLAVGKHFPGHGDTAVDSHFALPVVPHERARLEAIEFVPFKAAITAQVPAIMSAHVAFPAIDPSGTPATLSRPALTGLLRQEWGYQGLLVSDSLEMGALSSTLGLSRAQAAAASLAAGGDLLLFNHGHAEQREAHRLILERVQAGHIPLARLDEAVQRVLAAKARCGLLGPAADAAAATHQVGSQAHRALAYNLALQSITLLRDDARRLPLRAEAPPFVLETPALAGLGRLLGAEHVSLGAQPSAAELSELVGLAPSGRPVIVGVAELAQYPAQAELVNALLAAGAPVVLIAARDPYDLLSFAGAPTMLATYGLPPASLRALAAVLRGEASPGGRLPVELPGLFSPSAGLRAGPV